MLKKTEKSFKSLVKCHIDQGSQCDLSNFSLCSCFDIKTLDLKLLNQGSLSLERELMSQGNVSEYLSFPQAPHDCGLALHP